MDSTIETEVCIKTEPMCIQNELKKLSVLERIQLLNTIRQEEEQEEREKLKVLEQEENKENKENKEINISQCGRQMNVNTQAILQELRSLRMQIQEIRYEVQYLHRNQQKIPNQIQCDRVEEYDCDDSFSIMTLISEWMPMWIFLVFVVFALLGKPRVCSLSGGLETGSRIGISSCPITGLSDMFTKL